MVGPFWRGPGTGRSSCLPSETLGFVVRQGQMAGTELDVPTTSFPVLGDGENAQWEVVVGGGRVLPLSLPPGADRAR